MITSVFCFRGTVVLSFFISDCPELGKIANGSVVVDVGLSIGKIAIYSCDSKYDLVGDAERTCMDNSSWSGTEPYCKPKGK